MVFTCFAIVIKTALASKCDNLNLCFGCIQIHRRVELENIIDDIELKNDKSKESPKEIIINNKENDKRTVPKLDDSAFARFKNYKTESQTNDKTADTNKIPEKEYSRNIFMNLGRVSNFNFLQKPEKKNRLNGFYSKLLDGVSSEGELQKEAMNYSKFKEMIMKKNAVQNS
jgi:hypothetical protein